MKIKTLIISAALAMSANVAFAKNMLASLTEMIPAPSAKTASFAGGATYRLCFVPDGASCEQLLVDSINQTKRSLLIQAYSFTNTKIAGAVKHAKDRGVDVRVILDKSQYTEKYSSATFLKNAGIPIVIDNDPAIAHNKVMVFDQESVFTGSFNFSKSAQERNAENGIVIAGDQNVVKAFTDNFSKRFRASTQYNNR